MAYCESADVQTEFKNIKFNESDSAIVTADVDEFIEQASSEMDSRLSIRFTVPVTAGPSALSLLKQLCIWLVASRIKEIVEVKEVREEVDQDVKRDTGAKARKMLDDIVSGKINLIGAALATSADGVGSYVSANNIERVFKKNEEQW